MEHVYLRQENPNTKAAFKFKAIVLARGGSPITVKDYRKGLKKEIKKKRKGRKDSSRKEILPDGDYDMLDEENGQENEDDERGSNACDNESDDHAGGMFSDEVDGDAGGRSSDEEDGDASGKISDEDAPAEDENGNASPEDNHFFSRIKQRDLPFSAPRRVHKKTLQGRPQGKTRHKTQMNTEELSVPMTKTGPPVGQSKKKSTNNAAATNTEQRARPKPRAVKRARDNDDDDEEDASFQGFRPKKKPRSSPGRQEALDRPDEVRMTEDATTGSAHPDEPVATLPPQPERILHSVPSAASNKKRQPKAANKRKPAGEDPADMIGRPNERITRNKVMVVR